MPHSRSSKKRVRQTRTRTERNRAMRTAYRSLEKRIEELVTAGKAAEAKALLPEAYARLDKAAKRGVLHANTAANHKGRLARHVSKAKK
ncbi:MAG: 30S ribosomal protein S20 [Planctomycetia bacterium]